jgi:DNA repair protein RadD
MIRNKYLTQPIKIDLPVTSYDFSEVSDSQRMYSITEVEELLKRQKRLTPLIIKNIIDITNQYQRRGVMIFSSSVNHAKEILSFLPKNEAAIITGDTDQKNRDKIIEDFKQQKYKYLVNVSVLTTGFDAPHVDIIALLRPTESVSLYQQIIGRGLRLYPGKKDCYILDYAGLGHDIYSPEIGEKKPNKESVAVFVSCPKCGFENSFWGITDEQGNLIEHYGRKCRGAIHNPNTLEISPCGHRFRFKLCPACATENDITARECENCHQTLIDADSKLKQARLSKNAHILKPDSIEINEKQDKQGNFFVEIKYYDFDAKYLSEVFYLNNPTSLKKFSINFLRSHLRRPELAFEPSNAQEVIRYQKLYRTPAFIIARKNGKFWKITEKIFSEELTYSR